MIHGISSSFYFKVFKAAVCKFCLLVAISVENLVLQPGAELSLLRGLYFGTASVWMNLMFWGECVAVSYRTGVNPVRSNHRLVYVLEYMTQIRIFTILPSEQLSNKSATFVLPNWGKKALQ